ncbi:MAG: hypothetical protein GC154_04245 [bacterium]|nr:hypothetical protein [bacterium]
MNSYVNALEQFLARYIGAQAAHHCLLRFCAKRNLQINDLNPLYNHDLGIFLRDNLSVFTGNRRAHAIMGQLARAAQT